MTAYNFKTLLESFKTPKKESRLTEGNWYGVDGVEFIWNGAWSDPELKYQDKIFNSHDVEDALWEDYSEECKEAGKTPTEDEFDNWVLENKHLVYEYLDNLIEVNAFKPASDDKDWLDRIQIIKDTAKEGYDAKAQADIDAFLRTKIGKKMTATSDIMAHIEAIMNDYNNDKDISYGDLVYLQDHQDFIKEYYSDDPKLWELAGIPEEEWRAKDECSVTMQEDDGEEAPASEGDVVTIDTLVPWFPGFYETPLEHYEQHKDEVGQLWVDAINDAVSEALPSLSYSYQSIHSPKYYNFETDSVYASATFNKAELAQYLKDHMDHFAAFAGEHFKSYDGYMSFVPDRAEEYIADFEEAQGNELNRYLQGIVEFAITETNDIDKIRESFYYDVMDLPQDLVYIILTTTEDRSELYFTGNGVSPELKDADISYNEEQAESALRDAQKEYPGEDWKIRSLTEMDLEDYDPSWFND